MTHSRRLPILARLPAYRVTAGRCPAFRVIVGTMTSANGCDGQLLNETAINVAALLQAEIGARRCYQVRLAAFPLDDELIARDVNGEVKLTKLRDRILVDGAMDAEVELECVRCLTHYGQPVSAEFSEEYWQTVDVRSGYSVDPVDLLAEERDLEERFTIDDHHELDLREALRQHLVLGLPMRPDCGDECPGPQGLMPEDDEAETPTDNPFAALATLLNEDERR